MRKFIFAFLLLVPTLAFGQGLGLELTPSIGYRWGGEILAGQSDLFNFDTAIADSESYGITFSVPLTRTMELELLADHQSSNFEVNEDLFGPDNNLGDVDVTYYHAGLLFEFGGRDVHPFAVFGLGVANLNPDIPGASTESLFSGNIGGGVKIFMTPNIGLRLEGRGYWADTSDEDYHYDDCYHGCGDYYYYDDDLYQGEVRVGLIFAF